MSDGTDRANGSEASPEQLEAEIEALREELNPLVSEVDRRRHELTDLRLQVRRHALQIALAGAAVVVVAGAIVWLGMRRAQRRQTLLSRASRLREGVVRMIDHPERVASEPALTTKLLTAAATAVVGATAKMAADRLVKGALRWDSQPAATRWTPQERTAKAA